MDTATLEPISGEAIRILLLQLAGVLALARVLSELMRRLRQPAVIGELLAGIVLGPTILGHYLPTLSALVFPPTTRQFHLLEVISWIGMVLLLLLTGLETDVRVMRSVGKPAIFVSVGGMLVNFTLGGALGWFLPDQYLVSPATRPIFAAFIATALAITAMPVVAKILIDLGLVRRNIGVLILSAGVLDDTTGWLVLSVIAGIASAGVFSGTRLAWTLAGLAAYLVAMRYVLYPAFGRLLQYVNERVRVSGADVTLILVFTFLSAAATEMIGIHAVFGAFVTGLLIRQVPRVREASLHSIETFVLAALSPVFFAFVGLKVDLWALSGWQLPAIVIGLAVAGKLIGCYSGARLGGLPHWEALAIGFGMNARGAMGLVVALIGLSLGLLTPSMYSTIVLVAVVTSFLAPLLLRTVMPKLTMTEEERRRISDAGKSRFFPSGAVRILAPTAGGPNAEAVLSIAGSIVGAVGGDLVALYVERVSHRGAWAWLQRRWSPSRAGQGLEAQLERAAEHMGAQRRSFSSKRVVNVDPATAALSEVSRDYDLLMLGATSHRLTTGSITGRILAEASVPAVVVRAAPRAPLSRFTRLLVPLDGGVVSRAAAELAFLYARSVSAKVTLVYVVDEEQFATGSVAFPESRASHDVVAGERTTIEQRIHAEFTPLVDDADAFDVRVIASGDPTGTIIELANTGGFDLVVLGAENKTFGQPSFFGLGTAEILDHVACTVAVAIPRLG